MDRNVESAFLISGVFSYALRSTLKVRSIKRIPKYVYEKWSQKISFFRPQSMWPRLGENWTTSIDVLKACFVRFITQGCLNKQFSETILFILIPEYNQSNKL